MNHVELIVVGDLKFKELKKLESHYCELINYFLSFEIKRVAEIKLKEEEVVRQKEALQIKSLLKKGDYVVALDRLGEKVDSLQFSVFVKNTLQLPAKRLIFLIGGYGGLDDLLEPFLNKKISFSDLTFPHDLFRIIFLEQLYRALTIIKGLKYHR